MANKKISQLTPIPIPTGNSIIPIVYDGTTRSISLNDLFTYADNYYNISGFNPNSQTNTIDEFGNIYKQFKLIRGNALVTGADILRLSDGFLYVDKTGYFKQLISGQSALFDQATVTGDLVVYGRAVISGDIIWTALGNITGDFITTNTFNVSGNANISGLEILQDLNVGNNLNVTGHGNIANLGVSGALGVTGVLNTYNDMYLGNSIVNDIFFIGRAASDLIPNVNNGFDLGSSTYNWKDIYTNNIYVKNNIVTTGNFNLSGNIIVGDTTGIDTLTVFSTPTFKSETVLFENNVTISGDFRVSGNTTIGDWTNDSLTINSIAYTRNDLIASGNLNVSGNTTLGDSVNDILTIGATTFARGNATISGNLRISGTTNIGDNIADDLFVDATPTFRSTNVFVVNNEIISGNLNVSGSTTLGDSVNDILTIGATTFARGDATISGNLDVSKNITLQGSRVALSGNLVTTGYNLLTGISNVATNLRTTGNTLIARDDSMSGTFNFSGYNLLTGISNVATNLRTTGNTLIARDDSMSGTFNLSGYNLLTGISNVATNLRASGKYVEDEVTQLSGISVFTTGNQLIFGDKIITGNLFLNTGFYINISTGTQTITTGYLGGFTSNVKQTGQAFLSLYAPEYYRSTLRQQDGFGTDFTYQPSFADKTNIFCLRAKSTTLGNMQPISSVPYTTIGDINLAFSAVPSSGATLTGMVPGFSRVGNIPIGAPRNIFDSIPRFSMTGGSPNATIGVQFGFSGSGLFGPGSNPLPVGGSTFQFIRGTGDPFFGGYGGFYFKSIFGLGHMDPFMLTSLSTGYSRCSAFIGMWDGTCNDVAASNGGAVSGFAINSSGTANKANIMGIGFNSGDKFWSFVHNDNVGLPTYYNLGSNYPTYIPSGAFIKFSMTAIPNSGVGFFASIIGSGNRADISYLTYNNLPIANIPLSPNISFGLPGSQSLSGIYGPLGAVYSPNNSVIGTSGSLGAGNLPPILEACINSLYIESFL